MPRRSSFTSLMNQIARDAAKREREIQRQNKAYQAALQKAEREKIRQKAQAEKEAKQRYIESRFEEIDDLNKNLKEMLNELSNILGYTLDINDRISFEDLRIHDQFKEFKIPKELEKEIERESRESYFARIPKPNFVEKLIPGWEERYKKTLAEAERKYQEYETKINEIVEERKEKINLLNEEYNRDKQAFEAKVLQRNQEVDEFEKSYKEGLPEAIVAYCTMVLERSSYPDNFPQEFRIAYVPEPKEVVIEYELPNKDVVPLVLEYQYVKTKDIFTEKKRKSTEIKETYQDIVSAICLRTIHEVFEADQGNHIDVVAFNGFVHSIDPATGRNIKPHLVSVRTTKERYLEINLAKIEKRACLRNLGAQVSPKPDELVAVKPVVDFNMVDKRYIEHSDILSDLESRPNLMDLNPFEFENLINNLFEKIGFEAKLTRSSKDGGIDVVAFDPRPILGGKIVIQAKRYKNVVGVAAVRDLYGTMINEGASKGILVTTSHYGPDAYDFAKDKPIELIDGGGLLYLLDQNGVAARIIFPED